MSSKPSLETIFRAIGKLEGKVDGINARLDKTNGALSKHDDRINTLEDSVSNMKGKSVILGGIAGFVISIIAIAIGFFRK